MKLYEYAMFAIGFCLGAALYAASQHNGILCSVNLVFVAVNFAIWRDQRPRS